MSKKIKGADILINTENKSTYSASNISETDAAKLLVTSIELINRELKQDTPRLYKSRFDENYKEAVQPKREFFEIKIKLINNGDTSKVTDDDVIARIKFQLGDFL